MWLKWNGSVLSFQSRAFVSLVCAGRCVHYGNPLEGLLCSMTVVQCIYSLSCALCFCCTVQVPFLLQRCHADVVLVSGLGVTPEGLVPQSILYCGRCWCSLVQLLSASCVNIRLDGIGRQTSCFFSSGQANSNCFYICNTALPIEVDCECWVNTKATTVKSCIVLLLYVRVFVVVLCVCHSLSFHKTGNMRK